MLLKGYCSKEFGDKRNYEALSSSLPLLVHLILGHLWSPLPLPNLKHPPLTAALPYLLQPLTFDRCVAIIHHAFLMVLPM